MVHFINSKTEIFLPKDGNQTNPKPDQKPYPKDHHPHHGLHIRIYYIGQSFPYWPKPETSHQTD